MLAIPVIFQTVNFPCLFCKVILCPAIIFFTILLRAIHKELIVRRTDECNLLLPAMYEVLQIERKRKERKCASMSGWGSEHPSFRVAAKCANLYTVIHPQYFIL